MAMGRAAAHAVVSAKAGPRRRVYGQRSPDFPNSCIDICDFRHRVYPSSLASVRGPGGSRRPPEEGGRVEHHGRSGVHRLKAWTVGAAGRRSRRSPPVPRRRRRLRARAGIRASRSPSSPKLKVNRPVTLRLSAEGAAATCCSTSAIAVPGGVGPKKSIVAYSILCQHMGCPVEYRRKLREFVCPCHQTQYDPERLGVDHPGRRACAPLPRSAQVSGGAVWAVGVDGLDLRLPDQPRARQGA